MCVVSEQICLLHYFCILMRLISSEGLLEDQAPLSSSCMYLGA